MAIVAGLSTFDPTQTLAIGPWVGLAVLVLGRPLKVQIKAPIVLAILFASWAWASQMWTPDPGFTRATAVIWFQVTLMFIAAYDLIKTNGQLRLIAAGFIVGGVFTVVKNVYFGPEIVETMATGGRAVLGNANVNYVAYALTSALAMVVLMWVTRIRTKTSFLMLGGATALIITGLIVSDTRGAHLGAGCLLAWLVICAVTRHQPLKLVVLIVIVSAVCIATGVTDEASLAFESGSRVTGDWSGRLTIWPMAREMWAQNPLVGVGAGAFIVTSGLGVGAHNVILQTGTGLGLVGVSLLVALIWTALAPKRSEATPDQTLLVGAFLAASAPMYLSGMWESAPAAWMAIAIFARVDVLGVAAPQAGQLATVAGRQKPANVPDWMKRGAGKNFVRRPAP
jgi:O-antigen ligase